jgi:hypothetical protein
VELPKRNRVSYQQGQDNEKKAKREAGTDIKTTQVKSAFAHLFRPSGKFPEHQSLPILYLKLRARSLALERSVATVIRGLFTGHALLEAIPA